MCVCLCAVLLQTSHKRTKERRMTEYTGCQWVLLVHVKVQAQVYLSCTNLAGGFRYATKRFHVHHSRNNQ